MFAQQLLIDPRLVVIPVGIARADELHQIAIAGVIGGQDNQMIVRSGVGRLILDARFVESRSVRDVHLASDDRLDPHPAHGVVELDCAEHVAVIGDGAGRHAQPCHFLRQLFGAAGAVQK